MGLGPAVADCAAGDRWATRTAGHAVVPLGTTAVGRAPGIVIWGLAEDGVATVDITDVRGQTARATLGTNAFLLVLPAGGTPRVLIARDHTGLLLERVDLTTLRPGACVPGGPCPSG